MLDTLKDYKIAGAKTGIIFDIKHFAIHDGGGIRSTVFLKGCPMKCRWCHNPESQAKEPENFPGKVSIGERVSVEHVLAEIEKDTVFYDESGGGVTFSGGEPLLQPGFLSALLLECREREIHTIVDTCGYAVPQIFNSIIDKVDLFFYDMKLMDKEKHIEYTGVSNDRVNENLKTLSEKEKAVVIRFPVIPGITDSEKNLNDIADFLSPLKGIDEIPLLPHHDTAAAKYKKFKKENLMVGVKPPPAERIEEIEKRFTGSGLKVKIGG